MRWSLCWRRQCLIELGPTWLRDHLAWDQHRSSSTFDLHSLPSFVSINEELPAIRCPLLCSVASAGCSRQLKACPRFPGTSRVQGYFVKDLCSHWQTWQSWETLFQISTVPGKSGSGTGTLHEPTVASFEHCACTCAELPINLQRGDKPSLLQNCKTEESIEGYPGE